MSNLSRLVCEVVLVAALVVVSGGRYLHYKQVEFRMDQLEGRVQLQEESHKLEIEEITESYGHALKFLHKDIVKFKRALILI